MTEINTVQRRFTVTIPKKIREKIGLREGTELLWEIEGNKIIVRPVSVRNLLSRFEGKVEYTREAKEEVEKTFLLFSQK